MKGIRRDELGHVQYLETIVCLNVKNNDDCSHINRCFFGVWSMIGGLVAPIGFLLLLNTYILIRVHFPSHRLAPDPQQQNMEVPMPKLQSREHAWIAVCDIILLCLSLTFGYLHVLSPTDQTVQAVIIGYKVLQGLSFVLLHCIIPLDARKEMKEILGSCRLLLFLHAFPFFSRAVIPRPINQTRDTQPQAHGDVITAGPDRDVEPTIPAATDTYTYPKPSNARPTFDDEVITPRPRLKLEPLGPVVRRPDILQRSPVLRLLADQTLIAGPDFRSRLLEDAFKIPQLPQIQAQNRPIEISAAKPTCDEQVESSHFLDGNQQLCHNDQAGRNDETQCYMSSSFNGSMRRSLYDVDSETQESIL